PQSEQKHKPDDVERYSRLHKITPVVCKPDSNTLDARLLLNSVAKFEAHRGLYLAGKYTLQRLYTASRKVRVGCSATRQRPSSGAGICNRELRPQAKNHSRS